MRNGRAQILQFVIYRNLTCHLYSMDSSPTPKTYQYTFYSHYNTSTPPKHSAFSEPFAQRDRNKSSGHFTTIHSTPYTSKSDNTPSKVYREPIFQEKPYVAASSSYVDRNNTVSPPLTFPYKNPGCGIVLTGKSGFETKGEHCTIKIEKVLNQRKGGTSGTLRLQLIRMSYFYDGGSVIKPEEYTSVCSSDLGQLEGGWSLADILRGNLRRVDDPLESAYRKCYILLLQEYSQGKFRIVDYVNFD